jgi:hypothetical protein
MKKEILKCGRNIMLIKITDMVATCRKRWQSRDSSVCVATRLEAG